jgi:hypothetical protein
LNKESIHPIPSVLDLQSLARSVSSAEHVGIQSGIDLHERRVADCKYRGQQQQQQQRDGAFVDEKANSTDASNYYNNKPPFTPPLSAALDDPTSMLVVEDAPLRYDVDIVTKLIVYAGK